MVSRIHFKYWKNILISRLYEQIFKNWKIFNFTYIALKHVIWRFRICNYFCEISKFRGFMNTLRDFAKSVFAHMSAEFKYFVRQFMSTKSPDHVL